MRSAEDDPLPFGVWVSEIADLSDHCANAPPGEEDLVELVLERDGAEAAAELIAGERASFAIAPANAGTPRIAAEISFDRGPPVRAEGNSAAYAMIGAWANYFRTVH
jgi:hypothetical protein